MPFPRIWDIALEQEGENKKRVKSEMLKVKWPFFRNIEINLSSAAFLRPKRKNTSWWYYSLEQPNMALQVDGMHSLNAKCILGCYFMILFPLYQLWNEWDSWQAIYWRARMHHHHIQQEAFRDTYWSSHFILTSIIITIDSPPSQKIWQKHAIAFLISQRIIDHHRRVPFFFSKFSTHSS